MVKYQTVTDEDYLTSEKIWDKFEMKYMDDYHDNYFKKMYYNQYMFLKSLLVHL